MKRQAMPGTGLTEELVLVECKANEGENIVPCTRVARKHIDTNNMIAFELRCKNISSRYDHFGVRCKPIFILCLFALFRIEKTE